MQGWWGRLGRWDWPGGKGRDERPSESVVSAKVYPPADATGTASYPTSVPHLPNLPDLPHLPNLPYL
jgi:hypothetical protein